MRKKLEGAERRIQILAGEVLALNQERELLQQQHEACGGGGMRELALELGPLV